MTHGTYIMVTCTVPTKGMAISMSKILIEQKLVACVNIIYGIRSIYTWKGVVYDESEVMMVMKTRRSIFERLRDEIKANHEYECPEILAIPILDGNPQHLNWIDENTISS